MEPFENPELLPLEELKLRVKTDGIVEVVSALNKKWADRRYFLHYESPKLYNEDGSEIVGAKERWMEVVGYLIDDFKWLLGLPFYRFWSNVAFNSSIVDALASFLQEAPPFYALENFPNDLEMLELLEALHRHILVIFTRLVTNKESPAEYMSKAHHGKLLYDNYIFTVPIIFDLCQLYGRENANIVEKILSLLFTLEPNYKNDLQRAVPKLIEALECVEKRFSDGPGGYQEEAISLSNRGHAREEITIMQLEDMIIYILDISSNITVVLKSYSPAIKMFQREDFMNKIVCIYENTIPEMYKKLEKLANNDENMPKYIELKHRLDVTRVELINLYRIVLNELLSKIDKDMGRISDSELKNLVDECTAFLSVAISESEFITDYNQFYPVVYDLSILSNISPEIDTIKCDYLLQSLYATIGEAAVPVSNNSNNRMEAVAGPSNIPNVELAGSSGNTTTLGKTNESPKKDSVHLASLISEVKDILCDFGEGFIEMCLKHYNYESATVINAILEDTLPPHLKEIDTQLPLLPPDPMEASASVDLVLGAQRLNVFDNDEFDIMTRDSIDMSRVYNGKKKEKYKNFAEMLNDKSQIKKVSQIYDKYNIVTDNYNDEYDDTYDSHDVCGPTQDDAEVESRAFTTPRVLLSKQKIEMVSDDESESEEDNSKMPDSGRDHFIQSPSELRARAEQKRQARRNAKSARAGKPQGPGQDKDASSNNKDKKSTHKTTRANHIRRSGALWKQRQGMIPS